MASQKIYWTNNTLILISGTVNAVWSMKTTKDVSSVRWFNDQEELLEGEDFKLQTSEEKDHLEHSVIFNEVYPDDQGTYRVIIQNKNAETKESSAVLTGPGFTDIQNRLKCDNVILYSKWNRLSAETFETYPVVNYFPPVSNPKRDSRTNR